MKVALLTILTFKVHAIFVACYDQLLGLRGIGDSRKLLVQIRLLNEFSDEALCGWTRDRYQGIVKPCLKSEKETNRS